MSSPLTRVPGALAAVLIFAGLALYCMRDVVGQATTAYIGGGELQGWLWRYWWMKQLIYGAHASGSFLYTIYVALVSGSYPETGNVFDLQFFSMPLEHWLGAPLYYNVKVFLFLVMDGLAGYWLGRQMVGDWTASVVCGLAFAFSSFVLVEIDEGRVRQTAIFPLALYALALMKLQRPDAPLRRAVYAGLAFGLCSTVYLYFGMSALFISIIWLIALGGRLAGDDRRYRRAVVGVLALLTLLAALGAPSFLVSLVFLAGAAGLLAWIDRHEGRSRLRQILVVAVVAVLASAPYSLYYIKQVATGHPLTEVSWHRDFVPLRYLLNPPQPGEVNANLADSLVRFRYDSPSWNFPFLYAYRRSYYVVFTALALLGLLLYRRRPWFWVALMGFGYVLSLGPYLRYGPGEYYLQHFLGVDLPGGVPLPHVLFFKYFPYFSRLFSPVRLQGVFLLGMAVTVAWSLACTFERLRIHPLVRPLFVVLVVLLMQWQIQRSSLIPTCTTAEVPEVYQRIAASDAQGVIELPMGQGDVSNYYQIFHGKRVLDGWGCNALPPGMPDSPVRRLARPVPAQIMNGSFMAYLRDLDRDPTAAFQPQDLRQMRREGFRYVILHERGCQPLDPQHPRQLYDAMRGGLERALGPPVWEMVEPVRERWDDGGPLTAVFDLDRAQPAVSR